MSRQRDALPEIIGQLSEEHPGCGVLVSGSVQRGEEREDSDLDIFMVYPGNGEIRLDRVDRADGLRVDLARFPEAGFRAALPAEWFKFWMFSGAEIVHDPTGIAKRNQELARQRFAERSDIDAAWERQLPSRTLRLLRDYWRNDRPRFL